MWQLKTEPKFVDKLCAEDTFSGKSVVKLKTEIKLCVKIYFAWQSKHCRKTLRWVFKFWKYYAAHNSGLKIWLVSGIFEMAQLFNLKFCVYLCWLGVAFTPQFLSRETLHTIYFPNLRRPYSCWFFASYLQKIVAEKKSNELKKNRK